MENRDDKNPPTDQQTDLTKAQNQQQPFAEKDRSEFGQDKQQPPEGQADYGSAGQSDTATQQRSDIAGGTAFMPPGDDTFAGYANCCRNFSGPGAP